MPDVSPPDFINACKAILLNFGNLGTDDDRGDLATRIRQLASEAEVVATRIYGKGMTLREQQVRHEVYAVGLTYDKKRFSHQPVCSRTGPRVEGRDNVHF